MRITEKESGVHTKQETFVWCGARICQKRNGATVVRSYFRQGFEHGADDYVYTRDHIGSVREAVASDGTTVATRLSYDPWGRVAETGPVLSDFTYTGHFDDRPTGLNLAWYRGYDPNLGRWLSKDPIGLKGGPNLYAYVTDPVSMTDPTGLQHAPGGPDHPPPGEKMHCYKSDDCSTLSKKIDLIEATIASHREFDRSHEPDRHRKELRDFENARANCVALYNTYCTKQPQWRPVCEPLIIVPILIGGCLLCPECCVVPLMLAGASAT